MRCTYHVDSYVYIPSQHRSFHLSLHPSTVEVDVDVLNPNFTAGYLPAKPGNAAFVSSSALPDPDRAEPQQQHAASREERTEQRKETGSEEIR